MIPLIIAVFLVLFFLVAVGLSIKTWRATQVAAVVLTFLATVLLAISASLSSKTHSTWKKKYADAEAGLAKADADGQRLAYGSVQDVPWGQESIAGLQAQLNQLLVDRGRVWRHCPPSAPSGGTIAISTVAPNTPPEEMKPHKIDMGTVLHAFKEHPITGYPMIYLGEFRVVKADEQSVALQPTGTLYPFENQQVSQPDSTWALYEIMPLDKHEAFAVQPPDPLLSDNREQRLFGPMIGQQPDEPTPEQQPPSEPQPDGEAQPDVQQLQEHQFKNPFGAVAFQAQQIPIPDLMREYQKDGSPATQEDVSQSPENIWLKLEFLKEHTLRVDSNNPDAGLTGVYFDPEGYAVSAALRQGSDVSFQPKDIAVFPYSHEEDRKYVDGLISSGVCRNVGPYYVRDLRDYEEAFHDFNDRYVKCLEATRRVNRDIEALQAVISGTQEQTTLRQTEQSDLQADLAKYSFENQRISELAGVLDEQRTSLQTELRGLFETNLALNQELSDIDRLLTDEIDRRTAEAAAQVE